MIKKCLGLIFAFTTLGAAALPPMYQVNINNISQGYLIPKQAENLLYAKWCDSNGNPITITQLNPGINTFYVCETDPTRGAFGGNADFYINIDINNPTIGCYFTTTCHSSYSGQCTGNLEGLRYTTPPQKKYHSDCPAPVVVQPSAGSLGSVTFTINILQNQK